MPNLATRLFSKFGEILNRKNQPTNKPTAVFEKDKSGNQVSNFTPPPTPQPTPKPKSGGFFSGLKNFLPDFNSSPMVINKIPQPTLRPQSVPKPAPTPAPVVQLNDRVPSQYESVIRDSAKQYNVPEREFSNLLARESIGFRPDVIRGDLRSPAGAMGVAQFMAGTLNELVRLGYNEGQKIDPFDPNQAIPASAFYLNFLEKQLGSFDKAVAAYNVGIGRVQRALEVNPDLEQALKSLPLETQMYVPAVLGYTEAVGR